MNNIARSFCVLSLVLCSAVAVQGDPVFWSGLVDVNATVAGGNRINLSNLQNESNGVSYNNVFTNPTGGFIAPGLKTTSMGAIGISSAQVANTTMGLGTGNFGLLAVYALEGVTRFILPTDAPFILRNNFSPSDTVPNGTLPLAAAGGVLRIYDRSGLPDSLDLNDPASWLPGGVDADVVAELIVTPRAIAPPSPPYQAGNPLAGPNPTTIPQVIQEELVNSFVIDLNDAFGGSEGDIKLEFTDLFDVTQETAGSLFKNLMVDPGAVGPADDGTLVSYDLLTNLDQEGQSVNFPDLSNLANIGDANDLFDALLDSAFGAGNHLFSGVLLGDEFDNVTGGNDPIAGGDVGLINAGGIAVPGAQFETPVVEPEPAAILIWSVVGLVGLVAARSHRRGKPQPN